MALPFPSSAATLGLIAGSGRLPFELARAARASGLRVVAVGHIGETDPGLEAEVDAFTWVRVAQIKKIAAALKEGGASRAVFGGGLAKGASLSRARPDLEAVRLWMGLSRRGDDALLRAIAAWFEGQGLPIVAPAELLPDCFAAAGHLAGPSARASDLEEAERGLGLCKKLGAFDIGQTVVLREGVVLAVEAVEGTDACIARGGALAEGSVIVKAVKPGQDLRFDLPTIGPATVEAVAAARSHLLVVEAGGTMILDRPLLERCARERRVSVYGLAAPADG